MTNDFFIELSNKNGSIKFCYSETESPREWYNLTQFRFKHKRYSMPNEIADDITDELLMRMANKPRSNDPYIVKKVFMYDHSGLSFSLNPFGCNFDSGMIGFILVNKADWRKECNCKKVILQKVTKRMEVELGVFGDFVNGNVFGFEITNTDGEVIEYLGGFIGDDYKDAVVGNINKTDETEWIFELLEQL